MKNFFIKTYGCQINQRDSSAIAAILCHNGYIMSNEETEADIVLINTCSIRQRAEQKAINKCNLLFQMKRKKPNLIIGLMGCMVQNRGGDLLRNLPELNLLIGTQKIHKIPKHLKYLIGLLKDQRPSKYNTVIDLAEEKGSQNMIKYHNQKHCDISAFVSIMQGCNMRCSYCCVPSTRGIERSRGIDEIMQEVLILANNGTREIQLLGQIVTSYGRREMPFIRDKSPFVQLIETIHDIKEISRIRFMSPHPCGFKKDLIRLYRDLPKLCDHVHLPLQSGSGRILRAMQRPYSPEYYLDIVNQLRFNNKNIYISTDIIVGFPGETNEDFQKTCELFKEVKYDMAYIFQYSERPNTKAEGFFRNNIPEKVKTKRNKILLEILHDNSLMRNRSLIGKVEEVLVEKNSKKEQFMMEGRTKGNRKVLFRGSDGKLIGELIDIKICIVTAFTLVGEIITV